jgi:phosphohistidine phosphatase
MGELLADKNLVPQAILSSSARRARKTAETVAEAAGYDGDVTYLDELYGASEEDYLRALRQLPDDVEVALAVGHNPDLQYLVELLTGEADRFPTAAIAQIQLPVERWAEVCRDLEARLVMVWRPRELR